MNQKYILAILISFLINLMYSQKHNNGEVVYRASIEFDNLTTMLKDTSAQKRKAVLSLIKNSKVIEYKLLFKSEKSIFRTIEEVENENSRAFNLTKILAGKGIYFKNNITKESLKQVDTFGKLFLIKLNPSKWSLSQEIKKIGKYLCYKATTSIKVEGSWGKTDKLVIAWYAPEIPVSFGPKNYNGLPGLILELQEGKLIFKAIKIDLNSKEKIVINEPSKGKKITEVEFNSIAKRMVQQKRQNRDHR